MPCPGAGLPSRDQCIKYARHPHAWTCVLHSRRSVKPREHGLILSRQELLASSWGRVKMLKSFGGQKWEVAYSPSLCAQDPGGCQDAEVPSHPSGTYALRYLMPLRWILHSAFPQRWTMYWSCKRAFAHGSLKRHSSRESLPESFHSTRLAWTFLLSLGTCIMRVEISKW